MFSAAGARGVGVALEVRGLNMSFGAVVVAKDVGFSVRQGECLGVIGPNGAGKSSVFNMVAGTLRANSGQILLDGEAVQSLAAHERARRGLVRAFQIPQPFAHLTVYENVLAAATFAAGLRGAEAAEAAWHALEHTQLAAKAHGLAGAAPLLDRKRLELAKALAASPKVLLLDEIAGGLTDAEVHVLMELILELKPRVAMVWIEHVAHVLKVVADRILVLDFGCVLLDGPPDEVMDSAIVRRIYMGIPE